MIGSKVRAATFPSSSLLLSSPLRASERSEGRGVRKPTGRDTTRDSRTRGGMRRILQFKKYWIGWVFCYL